MSGGVDSSVAALLLKRAGHEVFGIHMRNWDEEEERGEFKGAGACSASQDLADAKDTCRALDIELREVNFVREYWTRVFEPTLEGYSAGVTPNPDVMCNREIKFDPLLDTALRMGAVALATGHYARIAYPEEGGEGAAGLLRAVDRFKDQSYFLSSVSGARLARSVFPLGGLPKARVREIAHEAGLPAAAKRESMGLCFIGKRDFKHFLAQYLPPAAPGRFVSIDGEDLGVNEGSHLYTIGQGARIGGAKGKWYVVSKDMRSGNVLVALGTDHPALFSSEFESAAPHWVRGSAPPLPSRYQFRVRHQGELVDGEVRELPGGGLHVRSDKPMRAIAPGQIAAFYDGEECLGCGPIAVGAGGSWAGVGGL